MGLLGEVWSRLTGAPRSASEDESTAPPTEIRRHSSGMEQFLHGVASIAASQSGAKVLDLGVSSDTNLECLRAHGVQPTATDWLYGLEQVNGTSPTWTASHQREFLDTFCGFRSVDYDGALLWDALQYMPADLRMEAVDRLASTLRPGSYLFALFYTEEQHLPQRAAGHHIVARNQLVSTPRTSRLVPGAISIRQVDDLFRNFESVKYFVSRGSTREAVIRR